VLLNGFADMLRAQLAVTLGAEPQEVSERTRAALEERKGRLEPGDLLRMLHLLAELEPRFKRSGQQQMLFEVFLVRLALLDRTVQIEELLAQLSGAADSNPSPRSGDPRPPAPAPRVREVAPPQASAPTPGASSRTASDSAVPRSATPSADKAPRVLPNEPSRAAADVEGVRRTWDDFRAAVRREKPVLATFVDKAKPVAITAAGALLLEVGDAQARDALNTRLGDLATLARSHFGPITQVLLREADAAQPPADAAARMTPASIRSETLASLRKRDPVLNAAIDELDLELLD
jgi:DNA polymerase-3 subunit gamma/tau